MDQFEPLHRLPIISCESDSDTEDSTVYKSSIEPTSTNQEQVSDTSSTDQHSVTLWHPDTTPKNVFCIPSEADRPKPICSVSEFSIKHKQIQQY